MRANERLPNCRCRFRNARTGLEAIEPHVGVFDRGAAAVEFGVKAGVGVLSLVGPQVTGNVGVDVTRGASLTQCVGKKGAVSVEERPARAMLAALSSTQSSSSKVARRKLSWWLLAYRLRLMMLLQGVTWLQ